MFCLLTVVALIFIGPTCKAADDPIVQLPDGLIRGKQTVSFTNKTYYQFGGIPYAAPPVGKLRFQPPVPPANWSGILDTPQLYVSCYQTHDDGYPDELTGSSEDCLYINVYTPDLPSETKNVSLPVLFYIHGGGFIFGSAMPSFTGPQFLIDEDIVIVTPNYRLGILGFLSTGDAVAPGNNGLKDQLLAIQWAHRNVALFGGDPEKIVIMGESAGGISVVYQLLNKKNEGLIRGVLASSGDAIAPHGLHRDLLNSSYAVAASLDNTFQNERNSTKLVEFLQTIPVEDLADVSAPYSWGPNLEPDVEGAFITEKMYGLIRDGSFVQVPLFIGFNSEEGLTSTLDTVSYDTNPALLVPVDMGIEEESESLSMGSDIRSFYTGNRTFADWPGGLYLSDDRVPRAAMKHAELQSNYTDVYVYQFSYDGELGNISINVPGTEHVAHAEDNHYLWCDRMCKEIDNVPEADRLTQKRLIRLFTNFVKYLNPTPTPDDELLQNLTLPKFDSQKYYININKTLEILTEVRGDSLTFWETLYKSLGRDDFDTY